MSGPMHYKCLGPEYFVPPLLHLEMGMVNNVWDEFDESVIDKDVEIVPPHEKDARDALSLSKDALAVAIDDKKGGDQMINIEIREKNTEVKLLKSELHKRTIDNERRQELHLKLILLETFIEQQRNQLKVLKDKVNSCQEAHISCKKVLETKRTERGKPEASIVAEVEYLLEQFKISHATYHGGDFNGVCCRRLAASAKPILDELRQILIRKKMKPVRMQQ